MSLPENRLSTAPVASAMLPPDAVVREDRRVDFELGGVAINDPSGGLQVRTWRAWVDGAQVNVAPWPENEPVTPLFSAEGVTDISLTFDQVMHPTVAFTQAGVAKLYWFDTVVGTQVTTPFPGTRSPMVTLDDKRALSTNSGVNDVLLFYLVGDQLAYRQQRDRFLIERFLADVPPGALRILSCGMGENNRVQVYFTTAPALFTDLASDTVYLTDADADVRALDDGPLQSGTWLSGIFLTDDQPTMGWVRVEAADYPVQLRIWGDGRLVSGRPLTDDRPARLPAFRAREWQVEVSGTSRVLAVHMAQSLQELEAGDGRDL